MAEQAVGEVAAAHQAMMRDRGLQLAFETDKPPEVPGWLKVFAEVLEGLAPILKLVFWVGLAAMAAAILYFIGRELWRIRLPERRARSKGNEAADWRPEPARARALLEEAEALAAAGRHGEAVRLILLRSIEDIEGRRPHLVKPALTSRDIARLESLPEGARRTFGGIAQVVEASFFGGRPVDAATFERCRTAYRDFALPETWS